MSTTVDQAFVTQWMDFVIHAVNQTQSRLSDAVRVKSNCVGSTARFNKLDDSDPYSGSRHGDTILADDAHSYADATLKDWHKALLVDEMDQLKTLVSLESEYTRNIIAAFQRRKDKTIIAEGLSQATPTYSVTGTTNGGLEYSTLVDAAALAEDLEWPEEERYFGYTGASLGTLLDDAQLTSKDYGTLRAIQDGRLAPNEMFLGFKWRKLNGPYLLAAGMRTGAVGSVTGEKLFAWHKDAVGLAIGKEAKVRIAERPDKNHSTQVYGCMSLGACKIDDERIIRLTIDY
jgi:hypothetical protein